MQSYTDRIENLRQFLEHERTAALDRVREYRTGHDEEALCAPGDELDYARALEDVQIHASLIERAEDRLRAIDAAFAMLEQGHYGGCVECGEEIPLARLKILPFATLCVECQQERNRAGNLRDPGWNGSARVWEAAGEIGESVGAFAFDFAASDGESLLQELPSIRRLVRRSETPKINPRHAGRRFAIR